jgi:hypothetical protein
MLFADGVEPGQFRGVILADLDGGRDQHGPEAGGVIDGQLRWWIPPEDRVLDAIAGGPDVETLAVPVKPVGAEMRRTASAVSSSSG